MTNYILLEGLPLYVFLFLITVLVLIGLIGLASAMYSDAKAEILRTELYAEREKNIAINRDNIRLKLKCGELKVGEKVDV